MQPKQPIGLDCRSPARSTIYVCGERMLIYPEWRTVTGLRLGAPAFVVLDRSRDDELIGGALIWALSQFRSAVPHPEFPRLNVPDRLRWNCAGVRSEREFERQTRRVAVDYEDGEFSITPYLTLPGKGFRELLDRRFAIARGVTAAELGGAIRRALDLCEFGLH